MIEMIGNHVAIERDPEIKESPGGIIFSRTEKSWTGRVVAVGPGVHSHADRRDPSSPLVWVPTEVKPGDRVLFSRHGLDEVMDGGKKLDVTVETQILAVILPEEVAA